ncbi:MAG: GTP-binding protein [Candidatus Deianiraeaceae bacterium]|jgi:GTP-binding protein
MKKEHRIFDEARIYIRAGNGGNGCVSFRREKSVPDGGPNGGDGGRGGDITVIGSANKNTLQMFRHTKKFIAKNGESGMGNEKTGKGGEGIIIEVPFGTQIYTETNELVFDITHESPEILFAKGGKGGLGNVHFKSSINQAPKESTGGEQGEGGDFFFKLKIISDIGLIGMPNAGKSSFLASVTNAKPKIGNYAFTTISPNLGIVEYNFQQIVLADIPGLIEGAGENCGLGHRFLKHIERTKLLIHLVDISNVDFIKNYMIVRKELAEFDKAHDSEICKKSELILLNKSDAVVDSQEKMKEFQRETRKRAVLNSNFSSEINDVVPIIYDFYIKS